MKNWLKAAERYDAAKQPGFKARKKRPEPEKPRPSFAAFMANGEGAAARKLLAASGQEICLGHSEEVMSRTVAVIIDGEGLKSHNGVVGMASAYSHEKPERKPLDVPEALRLLRSFHSEGSFHEDYFDEEAVLDNMCERLNEIAAKAP